MRDAIGCARRAARDGDDAVGAVLVVDDRVVGNGRNRVRSSGDLCAHAEIDAIRDASARAADASALVGSTLYTTEEPCPMCVWVMLKVGIARVVIGARYADLPDESVGQYRVERLLTLTDRHLEVIDGILTAECLAAHAGQF